MASDTTAERAIEDRELRERDQDTSQESADPVDSAGKFRDCGSYI
jgi:hypothetical protein